MVILCIYVFLTLLVGWCFSYERPLQHVLGEIEKLEHKPFMSTAETTTLVKVLCMKKIKTVLEFGTGGSTLVAALCNVETLYSVDSSMEWLQDLAKSNVWSTSRTKWFRLWADIGPLRDFGHPIQEDHPGFDTYSSVIEAIPSENIDVVFVDGRFRVACALRSFRFMGPDSVLVFHDYEREQYHVIEEFYEQTLLIDRIAIFRRKSMINLTRLSELTEKYKRDTL